MCLKCEENLDCSNNYILRFQERNFIIVYSFPRYLDYAILARGTKALFSEFVFISILLY